MEYDLGSCVILLSKCTPRDSVSAFYQLFQDAVPKANMHTEQKLSFLTCSVLFFLFLKESLPEGTCTLWRETKRESEKDLLHGGWSYHNPFSSLPLFLGCGTHICPAEPSVFFQAASSKDSNHGVGHVGSSCLTTPPAGLWRVF